MNINPLSQKREVKQIKEKHAFLLGAEKNQFMILIIAQNVHGKRKEYILKKYSRNLNIFPILFWVCLV